jgi:hypothetical protein
MRDEGRVDRHTTVHRLLRCSAIVLILASLPACTFKKEHRFHGEVTGLAGIMTVHDNGGGARISHRHHLRTERGEGMAMTISMMQEPEPITLLIGSPPDEMPPPVFLPRRRSAVVLLWIPKDGEGAASGWITLASSIPKDPSQTPEVGGLKRLDRDGDQWLQDLPNGRPPIGQWRRLVGTCRVEKLYNADSYDLVLNLIGEEISLQGRACSGYVLKPSKYLLLPLIPLLLLGDIFP